MIGWHKSGHGEMSYGNKGEYHMIKGVKRTYLTRKGLKGMIDKVGTYSCEEAAIAAAYEWESE